MLFAPNGIHATLRRLLSIYTGVEYLLVVGDDRIVPMARLTDRTVLLLETNYPAGGDLSPSATTVGQALHVNRYLSDDPLAAVVVHILFVQQGLIQAVSLAS